MPRVFDLSAEAAEAVLNAAGLDFYVERAQSTAVPEGSLISVSPRPDTPLDRDSRIVLTVSAGPPIAESDSA